MEEMITEVVRKLIAESMSTLGDFALTFLLGALSFAYGIFKNYFKFFVLGGIFLLMMSTLRPRRR